VAEEERDLFLMSALTWSQPGETITAARRLDPEYFDPRALQVAAKLDQHGAKALQEFVKGAWRGNSPEYDPAGTMRVIKTANVQRFELTSDPQEYVAESEAVNTARIPRGSLLITSTGVGSVGRSFAYFGNEELVADGHVTVMPLRCSDIGGAYIIAYLQSPAGRQQIVRLHRGSSRQIEIYPEDLLSLSIPWPAEEDRNTLGKKWLSVLKSVEDSRAYVRSTGQSLDGWFNDYIEVDIDLGTIPY
jgi:hypothetical protein